MFLLLKHISLLCILASFSSCAERGNAYDKAYAAIVKNESRNFVDRHCLELIGRGVGSLVDDQRAFIGLSYISRGLYTLEEARPMALEGARLFSDLLTEEPLFMLGVEKGWIVDGKGVVFKISFWNECSDRPVYPYLAQVRFSDRKLCYYYADPETGALQDPIEEAFVE